MKNSHAIVSMVYFTYIISIANEMDIEFKISEAPLEYLTTVSEMEARVNDVILKQKPELLWLLEHQNVYTMGTDSSIEQKVEYDTKIPFVHSGRGGKYTYHGPGQLIAYVILDLKKRNICDIKKFIWNLEELSIRTLKRFDIISIRKDNAPGVWIKTKNTEKKIVALGLRIRKWITFHGLAINISPNLTHYSYILPCGFSSEQVTSILDLGINVAISSVAKVFIEEFHKLFLTEANK